MKLSHLGHVIGYTLVITLAIVGTATAGAQLRIRSGDIVNGQVKTPDLGTNAVTSTKIAPDTVTGDDVKESSLSAVPRSEKVGGLPATAFARAPRMLSPGVADTLAPSECGVIFGYGVGSDADSNRLVIGYITDVNGDHVPSISNDTLFLPGGVFRTSQGGTIGSYEVCNPTSQPKQLPQGWKSVTRTFA